MGTDTLLKTQDINTTELWDCGGGQSWHKGKLSLKTRGPGFLSKLKIRWICLSDSFLFEEIFWG